MKYLLTTILLVSCFVGYGQKITFSRHPINPIWVKDSMIVTYYSVVYADSTHQVAYKTCDTCQLVVLDSAGLIRTMDLVITNQQKQITNLYDAQEMLQYIYLHGGNIGKQLLNQAARHQDSVLLKRKQNERTNTAH